MINVIKDEDSGQVSGTNMDEGRSKRSSSIFLKSPLITRKYISFLVSSKHSFDKLANYVAFTFDLTQRSALVLMYS